MRGWPLYTLGYLRQTGQVPETLVYETPIGLERHGQDGGLLAILS